MIIISVVSVKFQWPRLELDFPIGFMWSVRLVNYTVVSANSNQVSGSLTTSP